MIVIGCDPGLSGAICWMGTDGYVGHILDMPTLSLSRNGKGRREIDPQTLARIFSECNAGHAFIEQVHSMPKQGVSSTFAFGKAYGVLIGVLAARGIPMTFVDPRVWTRDMGVPKGKDGSRARASALIPNESGRWSLVKDHGKADAALIALWGIRSLNGIARGEAA